MRALVEHSDLAACRPRRARDDPATAPLTYHNDPFAESDASAAPAVLTRMLLSIWIGVASHSLSSRIEWNRVELTGVRHVQQVALAHADHHDADRLEHRSPVRHERRDGETP